METGSCGWMPGTGLTDLLFFSAKAKRMHLVF
jgi:hypothetical protein